MKHTHAKALLVVLVAFAACPPVSAQYEGGATADIGAGYRDQMLQDLVRSNTVPKPKRADGSPTDARRSRNPSSPVDSRNGRPLTARQSSAMRDARMREIRPEYERRVRTDGKASADQWLMRTAREAGRRDGAAMRGGQR